MKVRAKNRVQLSSSPLARPDSPIHILASEIQKYLYFPSPDGLYVVLGTIAGNMMKGTPVWTVLVGPPSSGKTILLDMIYYTDKYKLARSISVDMLESPASLLSGVGKKDKGKDATGGLLRQIGSTGLLLIKDFTTMMSMPRDQLVKTVGALRRVYDGNWDRPVGTDGGKLLSWYGKLALISACTGAIDRHHATLSELGERWIYYRYDDSDGYGETKAAIRNRDPKGTMQTINELVVGFFEDMGIEWVDGGMDRRELEDLESNRIYHMARFTSAARSAVSRDWRTKDIVDTPETEAPTRLAGAFSQLYLGLEMIGLEAVERWKILSKVAMDSMPLSRLKVIRRLIKGPAKPSELREDLMICLSSVRFVCEDLEQHGVVERVEKGNRWGNTAGSWQLSQWSKKELRLGWGDI